jgi:hypothetical protein
MTKMKSTGSPTTLSTTAKVPRIIWHRYSRIWHWREAGVLDNSLITLKSEAAPAETRSGALATIVANRVREQPARGG